MGLGDVEAAGRDGAVYRVLVGRVSLALLLKYWRETALVAVVLVAVALFRGRDDALKRAGAAEALTQVVRDSLRSNAKQIRVIDTLIRHDTLVQRRLIARTDTLRDSVIAHIHDTAFVVQFIKAADSTIHACTETTNDCATFRRLAESRFNGYEQEIAALHLARPRWYSDRVSIGPYVGVDQHGKPTFGAGVQLSLLRFP